MNEIAPLNATGITVQDAETVPHSIEAEQQLLGAILTNNDVYDRVASIIRSKHDGTLSVPYRGRRRPG